MLYELSSSQEENRGYAEMQLLKSSRKYLENCHYNYQKKKITQ